jgi:hypothetical protein
MLTVYRIMISDILISMRLLLGLILLAGCQTNKARDPAFFEQFHEQERLEMEAETEDIDQRARADGRCSRCPAILDPDF